MKISNSKQQLAKIISENGGWRNGAESAAQSKSDNAISFYCDTAYRDGDCWWGSHIVGGDISQNLLLPNWHQTILSREEYFHLYPAPDADGWIEWIEWNGGECSVEKGTLVDVIWRNGTERAGVKALHIGGAGHKFWVADGMVNDIIAYRLHKPDAVKPTDFGAIGDDETNLAVKDGLESMEYRPTIEQLASDYRNRLDYANRKQDEVDKANMESDAALAQLEDAIAAIGFVITPLVATEKGLSW